MELWFADSEVFAHDCLWVFKRQSDGRIEAFWNDPDGVEDFCYSEKPVLCGFNFRDYDSHILKATLLGWTLEQIKEVNDTIINFDDRSMVWAMFNGCGFVELPPIIDLFHDIVPRKGLKEIEANIGMSIVESSVSFDIDRELTSDERDEVLRYCLHDVDATEALYDLRFAYVKSKADLCEMCDIDPLTMLKHTNARIVSEVLGATKLPFEVTHERTADEKPVSYEIPDNVDITAIPDVVLEFVRGINTFNCEANTEDVEFMFHDCPTKVGLGGIHAAVPSYKETATDDRVILIQDIGSYYPSLIINNGYMSRAVSDSSAYERFYRMRMDAKAQGDKDTAEAAKLVLNTTFGTMKDGFNKMYDPMQGTRVCLSGQLYILDLIEQIFRVTSTAQLIQLNTDGWVVSVDKREVVALDEAVAIWQKRTGFTVDTDFIETIVQANVNNYVLRTVDGKVKAKGGVVARHAGGDFKSNSMTIIDKAVTDYLLDSTPIEQTIDECDDIERFQIVAKAGRTFQKVVHVQFYPDNESAANPVDVEVQRVNRVYATTDIWAGGIYKVKMDDGVEASRTKIPLTPPHCFVDNENIWQDTGRIDLTTLDKSWYVALAQQKANEFITRKKREREQMANVNEDNNEIKPEDVKAEEKPKKAAPKRKAAEKPDATVEVTVEAHVVPAMPPFKERLLELQKAMSGISDKVTFDGVVSNINYEYADTQQYKAFLAAACNQLGLIFKLDMTCEFLGNIAEGLLDNKGNPKASYAAQANGGIVISDAYSDERMHYEVCGFGNNVQAGYCLGAAQTNALRNFILNNFLLDNKGREGDDQQFNAMMDSKESTYASPEQKTAIKSGIANEKAAEKEFATVLYVDALHDKIVEVRAIKGNETKFSKIVETWFDADGKALPHPEFKGKALMPKQDATKAYTAAEEMIAKAGA